MELGIIGAGNMAQALFPPLKSFFQQQFSSIKIFTPTNNRAVILAEKLEANTVSAISALENCDVLLLAHKPQQLADVANSLKIKKDVALISILAAIDVAKLQKSFGVSKVLRLMPNTPAQVKKGVLTGYMTSEGKNIFEPWLAALSETSIVHLFDEEKMIDLTTPELGSGPGIVLECIRIFSHSLQEKGIEEKLAEKLSAQVFAGSGELVLKTKLAPQTLRDKVTSKGGITEKCLQEMSNNELENIFQKSFRAGHNRALELKK